MVVLCCWTGNLQSTHGPPVTVGERSFASAGIRDSGTVSQTTSRPPPRHRQTFDTNSKRIVFGNHIRMYVSSTSFDWGKGWNVTSAGWQVTLCDPIWHVSSVWRLRSPYCYRPICVTLLILRARVQPTLDPYADALSYPDIVWWFLLPRWTLTLFLVHLKNLAQLCNAGLPLPHRLRVT